MLPQALVLKLGTGDPQGSVGGCQGVCEKFADLVVGLLAIYVFRIPIQKHMKEQIILNIFWQQLCLLHEGSLAQ